MAKPIDDTLLLDSMAEEILYGRAHTPTGAMRLHGVEDGSADERRLLRKWKDGEGLKAMERMARFILGATVERHREDMTQHGMAEYERGYEERCKHEVEVAQAVEAMQARTPPSRPSWLSRFLSWSP